jgi:predicted transcriptional regulator
MVDDGDTVEIFSLILDTANQISSAAEGNQSSKIMYKTIFANPDLEEYWKALIKLRLLKYDSNTQLFKTTKKGQRFLQAYNRMK